MSKPQVKVVAPGPHHSKDCAGTQAVEDDPMPRPKTLEEPEHGWPLGWGASLREFRTFVMVERGLSPHTAAGYLSDLNHLAVWACGRGLPATDLTRDHLTASLVAQRSERTAP